MATPSPPHPTSPRRGVGGAAGAAREKLKVGHGNHSRATRETSNQQLNGAKAMKAKRNTPVPATSSPAEPAGGLPASKPSSPRDPNAISLRETKGETLGETVAKAMLGPGIRHGHIAAVLAGQMLSGTGEAVDLMDAAAIVDQRSAQAVSGDMSFASATLVSQATTCDMMFAEFARRSARQIGENIDVAERYARLAMKAQSNCRATLEALAKLHQPREQTVRHVHVGNGGQAVVADEFHQHHGRGLENERPDQCHAADAETAFTGTALPSPDTIGDGMPVPSRQGQAPLSDAWRE